jgi:hypothetical protein
MHRRPSRLRRTALRANYCGGRWFESTAAHSSSATLSITRTEVAVPRRIDLEDLSIGVPSGSPRYRMLFCSTSAIVPRIVGSPEAVRNLAAFLAIVWFVAGAAIEIGSYLPVDPEWSLLATAALFGSSFLIAAVGAFFMAPELSAISRWPTSLHWLRWLGVVWVIYTAIWLIALFTIPGVPTHCGTLGSPACGHEYVFNNHGSLTVTDRAGFLAGVRILVRVFASPTIAAMGVILIAYRLKGSLAQPGASSVAAGRSDRLGV